jgi:hypothetical protein
LSLACKSSTLKEREAIKKRADELRHYLNIYVGQDQDAGVQISDQQFYKRIALFNKLCYKCFRDDFSKITSQQVGPVDQEDNMREILSQMDLETLQTIF